MTASFSSGKRRSLINFLAVAFRIIRLKVLPLIHLYQAYLLCRASSIQPILLILILTTTTTAFGALLTLLFFIALLGSWLEQSKVGPMCRYCFYGALKIFGKIFHGYTINGLEHLTNCKSGLIIYYHIQLPVDVAYVAAEMYLKTGRVIGGIAHREFVGRPNFLFNFSKLGATKEECVRDLKAGRIQAIAPGGEREAVFSRNYEVLWNNRIGFAKLAKELDVPIFPLFCANGRETMPVTTYGFYDICLEVYEKTRSFFYSFLILLPVKLRIYIGEPLYCGETETPEEFAQRVKKAIEELRDTHQRRPGSIVAAFLERFQW